MSGDVLRQRATKLARELRDNWDSVNTEYLKREANGEPSDLSVEPRLHGQDFILGVLEKLLAVEAGKSEEEFHKKFVETVKHLRDKWEEEHDAWEEKWNFCDPGEPEVLEEGYWLGGSELTIYLFEKLVEKELFA